MNRKLSHHKRLDLSYPKPLINVPPFPDQTRNPTRSLEINQRTDRLRRPRPIQAEQWEGCILAVILLRGGGVRPPTSTYADGRRYITMINVMQRVSRGLIAWCFSDTMTMGCRRSCWNFGDSATKARHPSPPPLFLPSPFANKSWARCKSTAAQDTPLAE